MAKKKLIQAQNNDKEDLETVVGAETETQTSDNEPIGNDEPIEGNSEQTFADAQREEKEREENEAVKVEEKEFDLNAIMNEYGIGEEKRKTRKSRKSKEPEAARVQFIIPGRLFVTVCDNSISSAIGAVDSWISKNPINTDALKLNAQQIDDLSPLAEEAIKAMKLENDPITVYFGSLAAIYLSNYLGLRAHMNRMEKEYKERSNGKI